MYILRPEPQIQQPKNFWEKLYDKHPCRLTQFTKYCFGKKFNIKNNTNNKIAKNDDIPTDKDDIINKHPKYWKEKIYISQFLNNFFSEQLKELDEKLQNTMTNIKQINNKYNKDFYFPTRSTFFNCKNNNNVSKNKSKTNNIKDKNLKQKKELELLLKEKQKLNILNSILQNNFYLCGQLFFPVYIPKNTNNSFIKRN